jgi:uncharacterized glyoxalase superfamily protein PhnB
VADLGTYPTVVPYLLYEDVAAAISWLEDAFGFGERLRLAGDVDAHAARARSSGASILREPADEPYGHRRYDVEDLAGHVWSFSQPVREVPPEDWGATPRAR